MKGIFTVLLKLIVQRLVYDVKIFINRLRLGFTSVGQLSGNPNYRFPAPMEGNRTCVLTFSERPSLKGSAVPRDCRVITEGHGPA